MRIENKSSYGAKIKYLSSSLSSIDGTIGSNQALSYFVARVSTIAISCSCNVSINIESYSQNIPIYLLASIQDSTLGTYRFVKFITVLGPGTITITDMS